MQFSRPHDSGPQLACIVGEVVGQNFPNVQFMRTLKYALPRAVVQTRYSLALLILRQVE
jgi:hypothetical protein